MFAEVIYETGSSSVVESSDEAQLLAGLNDQHGRAVKGQVGGPARHPAERVKKVLLYDNHPGELNPDSTLSADEVKSRIAEYMKGKDVVDLNDLAAYVRDLTYPFVEDALIHDSKF